MRIRHVNIICSFVEYYFQIIGEAVPVCLFVYGVFACWLCRFGLCCNLLRLLRIYKRWAPAASARDEECPLLHGHSTVIETCMNENSFCPDLTLAE